MHLQHRYPSTPKEAIRLAMRDIAHEVLQTQTIAIRRHQTTSVPTNGKCAWGRPAQGSGTTDQDLLVEKHYPNGTIRSVDVPILPVNTFLDRLMGDGLISLLALDIEGIDAEIVLDINWRERNVFRVSFEHLHLGEKMGPVLRHLGRNGFMFVGNGLDPNGYDLLYENLKYDRRLNANYPQKAAV